MVSARKPPTQPSKCQASLRPPQAEGVGGVPPNEVASIFYEEQVILFSQIKTGGGGDGGGGGCETGGCTLTHGPRLLGIYINLLVALLSRWSAARWRRRPSTAGPAHPECPGTFLLLCCCTFSSCTSASRQNNNTLLYASTHYLFP